MSFCCGKGGVIIDKVIICQYSDALARVELLREEIFKQEAKIARMNENGYYETDCVTRVRKGKKPLGVVIIAGFPHETYQEVVSKMENRKRKLEIEEQNLLELITQVEEYIQSIDNVEMRNILTLYYINNLTWIRVAHRMNWIYRRKDKEKAYTADSCRVKHNRFFENN